MGVDVKNNIFCLDFKSEHFDENKIITSLLNHYFVKIGTRCMQINLLTFLFLFTIICMLIAIILTMILLLILFASAFYSAISFKSTWFIIDHTILLRRRYGCFSLNHIKNCINFHKKKCSIIAN